MPLINIIVGASMLLFGRRLFWLFVAGVGFLAGMMVATDWFGEKSGALTLMIALGVGLIGAILSIFLQRLVVAVAGFLSGAYLVYALALELKYESLAWVGFLVGGVIGAILMIALFDWALIGLSTLSGATVITQNLALDRSASALAFVALLIIGVVVQAKQMTRTARSREGE